MKLKVLTLIAALISLPVAGSAHTPLIATVPQSGEVLTESPPEIVLTFAEPVRLTSLVSKHANGQKRLKFLPTGESDSFTAASPDLPAGRNELRWKALSPDGHVVEGVIIVNIRKAP
ncbi:copper resistance CopC family protein [Asticcacaulis excentricus]|uniref:Copper resistance protein CopC n=1 Tax=Asticcacaulis excentricus (strain ATCC 15261 / DSM 4724 / KCTC 12464 / NCIMB 9791 / VKM B-1370 / CB 48) TaxID=573065 RepID=E8RM35_ASTEC|nr:copper resistance CopC family protein [Asticcacaulis excentricus]ADU12727.1 copper resistance protein CopC [Asticcacaulis excentricus CB 48]